MLNQIVKTIPVPYSPKKIVSLIKDNPGKFTGIKRSSYGNKFVKKLYYFYIWEMQTGALGYWLSMLKRKLYSS